MTVNTENSSGRMEMTGVTATRQQPRDFHDSTPFWMAWMMSGESVVQVVHEKNRVGVGADPADGVDRVADFLEDLLTPGQAYPPGAVPGEKPPCAFQRAGRPPHREASWVSTQRAGNPAFR